MAVFEGLPLNSKECPNVLKHWRNRHIDYYSNTLTYPKTPIRVPTEVPTHYSHFFIDLRNVNEHTISIMTRAPKEAEMDLKRELEKERQKEQAKERATHRRELSTDLDEKSELAKERAEEAAEERAERIAEIATEDAE